MAYIEEDVDLVRAREGALRAEMLACLQHLVILELVRVRFCGSLPLTDAEEEWRDQPSCRIAATHSYRFKMRELSH